MADVIWKAFKLGELFQRLTPPNTGKPAKELTIYEENDGCRIALVTRGEKNNGVVGYIEKNSFPTAKNKIIYNDQFGTILFHNYEFTTIKDHLSILEPINSLLSVLDQNTHAYVFITRLINKVFDKQIFNFNYSAADFKFPRELILLPVIEVKKENEYIWEEDGKFWTLAVDYIKKLMKKAKERKEEMTIQLYKVEKAKYEAEKAKYLAEKAIYETDYYKERTKIVWKAFCLGDLFQRITPPNTGNPAKELTIYEENDCHRIALVTRGEKNNGVVGYIEKNSFPTATNKIIYNDQFGTILFHNYEFTTIKDHLSILEPVNRLLSVLELNIYAYVFLTKLINKIFDKQIFGFNYSAADFKFPREIILLPVIEVKDENDCIWEENGKFWTLAVNTASYLFLQGQINIQQRKIKNYSYGY